MSTGFPPVADRLPGLVRVVVRGDATAPLGKPAVSLASLEGHGDDEPRAGDRVLRPAGDHVHLRHDRPLQGRDVLPRPRADLRATTPSTSSTGGARRSTARSPLPRRRPVGRHDVRPARRRRARGRRAVQRLPLLGRRPPLRRAGRDERLLDDPDPAEPRSHAGRQEPPARDVLHGQVRARRAAAGTVRRPFRRDLHLHRSRHRDRQPVRRVAGRLVRHRPRRTVPRRRGRRARPRGRPRRAGRAGAAAQAAVGDHHAATTARPRPPRRRSATCGSTPATRCGATRTATSTSSTG